MTKHFRKEHPAESIDHEEDADYSDVEQSDDEPSPDQDREDSPDSLEYFRDLKVKSETPVNAAASNYDASLWRLPAQTAQRPTHDQGAINADLRPGLPPQTVKMERSLSGTPQRALTDPARNPQIATTRYLGNRANTMPNTVSRSSSVDMAMWQAQQLQGSPTSMTPSQPFSMQTINAPTSAPTHYQHQPLPIRHPNLQPVHDIILDDPQQPHYSQTQPNYTAMQSPHYGPHRLLIFAMKCRGPQPQTNRYHSFHPPWKLRGLISPRKPFQWMTTTRPSNPSIISPPLKV